MNGWIEDAVSPNLPDLPPPIIAAIAQSATAATGSCRDAVKLASANKKLWGTLTGTPEMGTFWLQQCQRMGWSLEWLRLSQAAGQQPLLFLGWKYFTARMRTRWRFRRIMRTFTSFLGPLSSTALQSGVTVEELHAAEAALGVPLPWELFELFRWVNGQNEGAGRVDFLNGGRLPSLKECLSRHKLECPQESTRQAAFQEAAEHSTALLAHAVVHDDNETLRETPAVLFPFTTEIRGRRQYCLAMNGSVWLKSGFNCLHVADSLTDLLHRTLI